MNFLQDLNWIFLNPFNKVFKDRYIDERNKIRESLKAYEEQFPGTTTTGKIAGGTTTALASAMIPQTRILKTGSNILKKGANLAGGGALVGSATAIGAQEEDKGFNPETLGLVLKVLILVRFHL